MSEKINTRYTGHVHKCLDSLFCVKITVCHVSFYHMTICLIPRRVKSGSKGRHSHLLFYTITFVVGDVSSFQLWIKNLLKKSFKIHTLSSCTTSTYTCSTHIHLHFMDFPYFNQTFMYNLFMKIVNFWQKVEDKRMSTETVVMLKLTSKMEVSPT